MAKKSNARPVQKPARVAVVSDLKTDEIAVLRPDDGQHIDVPPRQRAIARTTVYAGARRGQRVRVSRPTTMSDDNDRLESSVLNHDAAAPVAVASPPERKREVTRAQLISRLADVIARRLDFIDAMTAQDGCAEAAKGGDERQARTIAMLVRVLTELKKEQGGDEGGPDDDADRPRDLDELRERLSRRLAERLGGRSALPVVDHDGGGDPVSH